MIVFPIRYRWEMYLQILNTLYYHDCVCDSFHEKLDPCVRLRTRSLNSDPTTKSWHLEQTLVVRSKPLSSSKQQKFGFRMLGMIAVLYEIIFIVKTFINIFTENRTSFCPSHLALHCHVMLIRIACCTSSLWFAHV